MTTTRRPARPPLLVKKVRGMGRGVFAGRAFRAGEVIEVCPVLVLAAGTTEATLGVLRHYVFKWGRDGDRLAVALGFGSLYNHSAEANVAFAPRVSKDEVVFRATRAVEPGEQLLIDYQWDESDYQAFSR